MSSKQKFYERIQNEYGKTETAEIVSNNPECEYYELCQAFLDIALNSLKIKSKHGEIMGVFQHSDIKIAKEKSIIFMKKYNIVDVDNFFYTIEKLYPLSVEPQDCRQKSGFYKEEKSDYNGYVGTLLLFEYISEDVFIKIINEIKDEYNREE